MPRQRKQKFLPQTFEPATVSTPPKQSNDPFLPIGSPGEHSPGYFQLDNLPQTFAHEDTDGKMFLATDENHLSPPDWLLDHSTPLYTNDFLDVTALLGLDDTALSLLDSDYEPTQENRETFQDLKFTSTPKSRSRPEDSGIGDSVGPIKKFKPTYKTVLHDIQNFPSTHNYDHSSAEIGKSVEDKCHGEKFINLADTSRLSNPDNTNECFIKISDTIREQQPSDPAPLQNTLLQRTQIQAPPTQPVENFNAERNISIIRKKIQYVRPLGQNVKDEEIMNAEQLIYYTGISKYDVAVAFMKHIKLKPSSSFSNHKMLLMALMKLRLGLEWKDMAYRFGTNEEVVRLLITDTIQTLSVSVVDLLPWLVSKKCLRKSPRTFFVNTFHYCSSQILIVICEGKFPVQYVSKPTSSLKPSIIILLSECSQFLVPGDLICIAPQYDFYRILKSGKQLSYSPLAKNLRSMFSSFVLTIQHTLSQIGNYTLTTSNKNAEGVDVEKAVLISCALTNLNNLTKPGIALFRKFFERSSKACL